MFPVCLVLLYRYIKKELMKKEDDLFYVKRTQRDYSLSFKLQVVSEVESEELSITGALRKYGIQSHGTVLNWIRKYGTFDREFQIQRIMSKTPEQKILELEQRVKLLEKQKSSLEKQVEIAEEKAIFFDMMINIAEKDLKVPIRKKSLSEQSKSTRKNVKDQ
jgi:transposase